MKTGTIRRIDSLGRIVLPKDIRQSLRIKSGDSLEILIENKEIILKKYSELNRINNLGNKIVDVLKENIEANIFITDKDKVIITSGKQHKELLNQEINKNILDIIEARQTIIKENSTLKLTKKEIIGNYIIKPLIINGDIVGSIILFSKKKIDEFEIKVLNMLSTFLIKNIE